MTLDEYKSKYTEDDAVGWDCIDEQLERFYDQESRHYGSVLPMMLGGGDPLDGVSIYDSEKQTFHRHIISYGMSDLYYNEDAVEHEYSCWGFEFTMRIKANKGEDDPTWAINVMQNLARYVNSSEKWFEEYHFIPANGPICLDQETDMVGVAFAIDPELGVLNTPNGELIFLQMVGITSKELERLMANPTKLEVKTLLDELRKDNPLLITDMDRK